MASVFSLVPCILRVGRGAHGLLFRKRPHQLQTLRFLYLFTKMINLFGLFHERYQMDPYSSNEVVFKMSDSSEIVGIIVVYMTGDISVKSFVIYLKTPTGGEALNENGLIPQSIHLFKDKYPIIVIYTKASLASYFSYWHDDNVRVNGIIMHNEIVLPLCKQAISQARAGADIISVSDMKDQSIKNSYRINSTNYTYEKEYMNLQFDDAETYQMNSFKPIEAILKMKMNSSEGADLIMVMPGFAHTDVISYFRSNISLPIVAYQVSGELYYLRSTSLEWKWTVEMTILSALENIKNAGADMIFTCWARRAAVLLAAENQTGLDD